eukprot:TRINITY_DN5750_c0_g1_i2.p1 TRINITY_DN5750_c0_g1~~TRINITY_DN5750_c0_g1_i2.p1  ORF type:complete len:1644 (-),score=438.19 TRINITY_DN5750_c0_g1_i2:58-4989(-)
MMNQLGIMLTKNCWLHWRSKKMTLCELLAPIVLVVLAAFYFFMFSMLSDATSNTVKDYPEEPLRGWADSTSAFRCKQHCVFCVVPDDAETKHLGALIWQHVAAGSPDTELGLQFFASQKALEDFHADNDTVGVFAAIFFDDPPAYHHYGIRIMADLIPADTETTSSASANPFSAMYSFLTNSSMYEQSGFLTVQAATEQVLQQYALQQSGGNNVSVSLNLATKLLPSDQPIVDLMSLLPLILPSFFLLAFVPVLIVNMLHLVAEKTSKVRDYLQISGLQLKVYWISWAITLAVPLLFTVLMMVVVGFASGMFKHNDFVLVTLLFVLFAFSVLTFCFMAQAFINNKTVAMIVSVVWVYVIGALLPYLPASSAMYASLSVIAPVAFYLGIHDVIAGEISGDGVSWSTLGTPADDYSVCYAVTLVMLALDSFIYLVLAWYFNEIAPGEYGVPKPFYFPFLRSYWCPRSTKSATSTSPELSVMGINSGDMFESFDEEAAGTKQDLVLQNLCKQFSDNTGNTVKAVDGISVTLYRGQIFALLGHNGAGKTTTISMLTGLIPPTSGDALVEGLSIRTSMDEVRRRIGVCPQHDLLYDDLTAEEHLTLFGRLKGIPRSQIAAKVREMIEAVDLQEVLQTKNKLVRTFSGGMKRKLSLAIALIGDSKVVFLDEPSSGVDPLSRHKLWTLLKQSKEGRTIVLTTHSMEEADVLSDRIFIMADGRFKCGGTPSFLKNRFGIGYYLCVNKANEECQPGAVLDFVSRFAPGASVCADTYNSLTVLLPQAAISCFGVLFKELEACYRSLNVESYGLSNTTLEDVFLRITSAAVEERGHAEEKGKEQVEEGGTTKQSLETDDALTDNDDVPLMQAEEGSAAQGRSAPWYQQFMAIGKQKILCHWRNKKQLLCLVLLPAVMVTLILLPLQFTEYTMPTAKMERNNITIYNMLNTTIPYVASPRCDSADVARFLDLSAVPGLSYQEMRSVAELENVTFDQGGYIAGLLFDVFSLAERSFNVTVMFNQTEDDSSVAVLNLVGSSVAQLLVEQDSANTSAAPSASKSQLMYVTSFPLAGSNYSTTAGIVEYVYISLLLGVLFVSAMAAKQLVFQREHCLTAQLYLIGLRVWVYVTANWLLDIAVLLPGFVVVWGVVWAFQVPGITGVTFIAFVLLCLEFSVAIVLLNHLVSLIFSKSEHCLKWIVVVDFVLTLIPVAIVFLLLSFSSDLGDIVETIAPYINNCLPTCSFMAGMEALVNLATEKNNKQTLGDAFAWGSNFPLTLLIMGAETVVIGTFVMSFEIFMQRVTTPKPRFQPTATQEQEDSDVHAERQRIESALVDESSTVTVNQVCKRFNGKTVVENLSFGIESNVCFGLLGPNGAGKTTTISMVTGDLPVTAGEIHMQGQRMEGYRQRLYRSMALGRCLQSNALFDYLTGREHLDLYLSIRQHLPLQRKRQIIDHALRELDLVPAADRITKNYSGGNWRKLSVALATLPGTEVIFLDEPSTGMDPVTRRGLWSVVQREREHGRVVVLTTHSMEEAEKLCTKLAIIVKGRLQCLGTVQHLKNKFGGGYRITLEQAHSAMNAACELVIQQLFPDGTAKLLVQFMNRWTYSVARIDSLSAVFLALEQAKAAGAIVTYSVSQTSLEEVFLHLATQQEVV